MKRIFVWLIFAAIIPVASFAASTKQGIKATPLQLKLFGNLNAKVIVFNKWGEKVVPGLQSLERDRTLTLQVNKELMAMGEIGIVCSELNLTINVCTFTCLEEAAGLNAHIYNLAGEEVANTRSIASGVNEKRFDNINVKLWLDLRNPAAPILNIYVDKV